MPKRSTSNEGWNAFGRLINRNITVDGHRTSMRLEPAMWDALADIGKRENLTISELVTLMRHQTVTLHGEPDNLTSIVRVFIAAYYRRAATEAGHKEAGHGRGNPFTGGAFDQDHRLPPEDAGM